MFTYLAGPQLTKYLLLTGDLIDGVTAANRGLALWALESDELDERVQALAKRIAGIPSELLAANKAICEKVLDAMGRSQMQRAAIEADAMAHKSQALKTFFEIGKRNGYKAALAALEK
jgi:enoyl-CoA hydratase